MTQFIDRTGQPFGRLVVKSRLPNRKNKVVWLCTCECDGKDVVVLADSLRSGKIVSCGCFRAESLSNYRALLSPTTTLCEVEGCQEKRWKRWKRCKLCRHHYDSKPTNKARKNRVHSEWWTANPISRKRKYEGLNYKFNRLRYQAKLRGLEFAVSQVEYRKLVSGACCTYCQGSLPEMGYGIDRVDSQLGYLLTNVKPCCGSCNRKKGLLEWAGFIYPRTVELLKELLEKESAMHSTH